MQPGSPSPLEPPGVAYPPLPCAVMAGSSYGLTASLFHDGPERLGLHKQPHEVGTRQWKTSNLEQLRINIYLEQGDNEWLFFISRPSQMLFIRVCQSETILSCMWVHCQEFPGIHLNKIEGILYNPILKSKEAIEGEVQRLGCLSCTETFRLGGLIHTAFSSASLMINRMFF